MDRDTDEGVLRPDEVDTPAGAVPDADGEATTGVAIGEVVGTVVLEAGMEAVPGMDPAPGSGPAVEAEMDPRMELPAEEELLTEAAGVVAPATVTSGKPPDWLTEASVVTVTTDGAVHAAEPVADGDEVTGVGKLVIGIVSSDLLLKLSVTVTIEGAKFVADAGAVSSEGAVDDDVLVNTVRGQGASSVDETPLTAVWTAQSCPDNSVGVIKTAEEGVVRSGDKNEWDVQVVSSAVKAGVRETGAFDPGSEVAAGTVTSPLGTLVVSTAETTEPTTIAASFSNELTSGGGTALVSDATTPDVR